MERGYADMTMIVRPDMRQFDLLDFLIEFKYVPLGQNNLTGQQVKQMSLEDLQALAPVQEALATSASKLAGYRDTLPGAYGDKVSSQYSGETRPELVEGRWFRQAQPTLPRFIEEIQRIERLLKKRPKINPASLPSLNLSRKMYASTYSACSIAITQSSCSSITVGDG